MQKKFSANVLLIYNKTFQRHRLLFTREVEENAKIHIYKHDQYQLLNVLNLDTLVMWYELVQFSNSTSRKLGD